MKKFIFVFFKHKALCFTPEEAITFIDGLPGISCNAKTDSFVRALFETDVPASRDSHLINNMVSVERDGFIHYIYAKGNTIKTTGCGKASISIHEAPADTLEECEAIYLGEKEERERREAVCREAYLQAQLADLYRPRKGWYSVEMTYRQAYSHPTLGIERRWKTFTGELIAGSGKEAYDKTIKYLSDRMDNLPDSLYPAETDNKFGFVFLGMRTDDGYSVEAWEKYMDETND